VEGWSLAQAKERVERILDFVRRHPESYASLAVCRRALDGEVARVTPEIVDELARSLEEAPEDEVMAYFSIVS